jgi:hypothetical protein
MGNALLDLQREFEKKRDETGDMISACYAKAVRQVGEEEARRIWHTVAKAKKGKPTGTTNKERDELFLSRYDAWVRRFPNKTSWAVSYVADYLTRKFPGKYQSAEAIKVHLRRLLEKRGKARPAGRNALLDFAKTGKWPESALRLPTNK